MCSPPPTNKVALKITDTLCLIRYRIYHLYYPGTPFGISLWILIFGISQIFVSLVCALLPPALPSSRVRNLALAIHHV